MRTITFCLISLALIGTALAADGTVVTSQSVTTGTFATAPVQVLDATATTANATDTAKWGSGKNVDLTTVAFGPGATNDTIYMWAATTTTASSVVTLTGFISRKISATQILNGTSNSAKEESVLSAGDTGSASATISGPYKWAVAPGTYGLASGQTVPTTGTTTSYNVVLNIVSPGGSSKAVTLVTGPTIVADASSGTVTGSVTKYAVDAIFSEDGGYYVLYETLVRTQATTTPTYTYALSGLYIQGAFANGTVVYTTPQTVSTSFAAATTALVTSTTFAGPSSIVMGMMVGQNATNSTNFLVGYTEDSATGIKVGTLGKTAGSTFTSNTFTKTATAGTKSYTLTLGGIWAGKGTYGFSLINSTTDSSTSTTTYGVVGAFNGTSALNGLGTLPTGSNSIYSVNGYRYTTGLFGVSATASSSQIAYNALGFYGNITTVNGSLATIGSFDTSAIQPQYFVDVNGTAWVGYASTAVTTTGGTAAAANPGVAYIGRILAQTNVAGTSAAANALTTIAALLSFVIASIFMF